MIEWVRSRLSKTVDPPGIPWKTDEPVEPLPPLSDQESRAATKEMFSQALESPDPIKGLIRADAILKATVDSRAQTIIKEFHGEGKPAIMCRKGCGHCCQLSVSVFAHEVFAISDHVNRTWTARERKRLLRRIDNYRKRSAKVKPEAFFSKCPFLQEESCSIHAVRPALCRAHHSTDLQSCISNLKKRPPGAHPFYRSALPLIDGAKIALGDRAGYPSGLDMALAVGIALTNPEALSEFEAGGDPFKSVRKRLENPA